MNLNNLPLDLTGLTEANRPIRLRLSTAKGVVDDLLLVKQVSGVETICGGIEYSLLCVSTQAGMKLKQFMANPVELQFVTDSGGLWSVCGIVGGVVEGHGDGGLATYQLIVRDAFSLFEKSCNTRVFRNASEADITNIILREMNDLIATRARRVGPTLLAFSLAFGIALWLIWRTETSAPRIFTDGDLMNRLLILPAFFAGAVLIMISAFAASPAIAAPVAAAPAAATPAKSFMAQVVVGLQWLNPLQRRDYPTEWQLLWTLGLVQPNKGDDMLKTEPKLFSKVQAVIRGEWGKRPASRYPLLDLLFSIQRFHAVRTL